ncbi:hypothetical protein H2200_003055 [Cladophialophora chaetospira]|uniref:NADP-dependent oxidoreductase domain-containing protein n=1 Tax=Cladophialophora chaetospira TaxID=386627 RepID=A0AA39CL42_9EURO|nr:hypothetical protein H2200_003055 [Cladophialophora chaetospira]
MGSEAIKVVFGTVPIGNSKPWDEEEYINEGFSILQAHGVETLDTARLYGESEKRLGEVKAGDKFVIDTKWTGGFIPGNASRDKIIEDAKDSVAKLGVKQVDIFYLHAPDESSALEDTLAGVNEVYRTGLFKRFGISNFSATDVEKIIDICNTNGYILPTVYQGNYSPVARLQESKLFPTLRKHGLAFYAYSPLAGGFLTKTAQQIKDGAGRFDENAVGGMYRSMYMKPAFLEALAKWEGIASDEGCTRAELAYRWVAHSSGLKKHYGDAIIVGASSCEQLEQTLAGIEKGPLSEQALKAIDAVWEGIKHEAPLDNFNR